MILLGVRELKKKTRKIVRNGEEEPKRHTILKKMVHNLQEEVNKKKKYLEEMSEETRERRLEREN